MRSLLDDADARAALRALIALKVPLSAIANATRTHVGCVRQWLDGGPIEELAATRLALVAHAVDFLAKRVREIDDAPPRLIRTKPPLGLGFEDLLSRMQARDAARQS